MILADANMFRRVMIKLTVVNAAVMLMVLAVFSTVLYGYVSNKLFDYVDASMMRAIVEFNETNRIARYQPPFGGGGYFGDARQQLLQQMLKRRPPLVDMRMTVAVEDINGNIIWPQTDEKINPEDVRTLLADATARPQTKKLNDHDYRIVRMEYPPDNCPVVRFARNSTVTAKSLAVVAVVDPEMHLLKQLKTIIFLGMVFGGLVTILGGYYLARRSIIPIKAAWDKQQQFVSDASHELRTPLAVINTNAELLLHHPDSTIEQQSVKVAAILRESSRLGKLVSTLLTLARADSNQLEMNHGVVALDEVLKNAAQQFEPIADMKGLNLSTDIKDGVNVLGDQERLTQLAVILLDNAVKYTPAGGSIALALALSGGWAEITVKDTGIGISEQDIPYVFDRFYRGDKARSREEGGSGLGLAIAKWIVDKHRGKIRVESAVGQGTAFTVNLPLQKNIKS